MKINNAVRLSQNKRIFFEETSVYTIELKNVKCAKNTAVVNCTFAPEGNESIDKILEKWIKAINLND